MNIRSEKYEKNTGFTLIELLAVIVILAVIALIVTPIVTGIITKAKDSSYDRSVEGFGKAAEFSITRSEFKDSNDNSAEGTYTIDEFESKFGKIEYNGSPITECIINVSDKNQVTLRKCKVNGSYKSDYVPLDPPIVTAKIEKLATTNYSDYKITATVTSTDTNIKYKYYYKKSTDADFTELTSCSNTSNECIINNLYVYNSYNAKVIVTDSEGNTVTKDLTAGPSCFVAGTKVLTESGLVNIENIKVGDKVYTLNLETNTRELQQVINTIQNESSEIYEIKVNDKLIKATPKHKFYVVDKGWIQASELQVGDVLDGKDTKMEIQSIEYKQLEQPITVYNLVVNNTHNYLVTESEILVHNVGSPSVG